MKIGFIGTGNMGSAIIKAYSNSAARADAEILAYNRTLAKAEALAESCTILVASNIEEIVTKSDIIFVCVEPKNFAEVMPEIAKHFEADKVLVSIAAGITIDALESYLGSDAKVIRTMPNTPIMHGLGVTAMVRNSNVSDADFEAVKAIFEAGGTLIKAGVESGLDPEMSRQFAAQAVMGAARMVMASEESPSVLCDRVCTPGGTTIEAVTSLKKADFEDVVKSGALAAVERSKEMSKA